MRHSRSVPAALTVLVAAGLAPLAAAQAEPGVLRGPAANPAFVVPPSHITIYTDQLAGDAPGVFTCCLTTQSSPFTPPDVAIGAYDPTRGTFTPTSEANALNSSRFDVGLNLEPRLGRYAVLMRGDGMPTEHLFAARARPGLPFPAPVQIPGVPAGTYSIALGYVEGQLKLFYVPAPYATVLMQDFNISNLAAPKLTGTAVVVARPSAASRRVLLATPITGADGDVEGLLITEGSTPRDAGLMFQAGLDPSRPGSVVVPSCGTGCAIQYPAVAGGRLLYSASVPSKPSSIQDVEVAWLLGDVVAPGGRADITGAVSRSPKATTFVFLSGGVIPKVRLPAPFDVGHFALDLGTMSLLGAMSHADASQRGRLSFPMPNDPQLRGVFAAIQGVSLGANAQPLALTNTAWLSVR